MKSLIYKTLVVFSLMILIGTQQAVAITDNDVSCAVAGGTGGTCFYGPGSCGTQTSSDTSASTDTGSAATAETSANDQSSSCCSGSSSTNASASGPTTHSGAIGGFALDQVKTFANEPVTSTWNISDNTVEQWFLKQTGAQTAISKFGLNSGNIGQITSAVKAANVSPVFFYLYTVNEGSTAGGFINHYQGDAPGGGVANATRDAQYISSQSKIMDSQPSWVDAGYPVDFVPQSVKDAGDADFKKMPSGTIGRIYIPATAATTWEVYYPNGLLKAYNKVQDYGPTLSAMIQNIKTMGGDPQQGGATVSTAGCTTTGVTGQGMQKGISFAVAIANNNGYGYDQPTRETGWQKYQSDPSCTTQCGSFDCSSFISAVVTEAGYFKTNPNFDTLKEAADLEQAGFKQVANSAHTSAGLEPGDILLQAEHTEMYIGNDKNVGAHMNENNQTVGGQVGDQNGNEISITGFYDDGWTAVFRAPN